MVKELPIYKSTHYEYILLEDMEEGYEKRELEQFMKGKFQPLVFMTGRGTRNDAIFLKDYQEFQDYLAGKRAKVAP